MVYKAFSTYLPTLIAGAGGSPILQTRVLRFGEVKILVLKRVPETLTNISGLKLGSFQVTVKKPSNHIWYFFTILF